MDHQGKALMIFGYLKNRDMMKKETPFGLKASQIHPGDLPVRIRAAAAIMHDVITVRCTTAAAAG